MDKIVVLILCFNFCWAKIKINRLDVPAAILYGSQNEVTLDCDFDSGGDTVTEIKWFLDGDTQIYQWLPTTNTAARALGKLKNHIDTAYKATDNKESMYRALHITDLSPEFSGNYTCKVSGPMSEDVETKRMVIYVVPEDDETTDEDDDDVFDLSISEDSSQITCNASGFYPEPNMTLYIVNENDTDIIFRQDHETVLATEEGYYNVSSVLEFDPLNLTQSFYYFCEINIPGTPYNVSVRWTHSQEDIGETQVEEDLVYATNSTEDWSDSPAAFELVEVQIEEESNFSTTPASETSTNPGEYVTEIEIQILEESASPRHLPPLLSVIVMLALLGPLRL